MTTSARPAASRPVLRPASPRRRRRVVWVRFAPLLVAGGLAFIGGLVVGAGGEDARRAAARDFTTAWQRGDYAAMHALLTPAAQRDVPLDRFAAAYRRAAGTSTLSAVEAGRPSDPGPDGVVRVPMTIRTRVFGTVQEPLALPMQDDEEGAYVQWQPHLVFPGLQEGEKLNRSTRVPPRAALQARDGTVLATGEARTGSAGVAAADIVGTIGPAPPERAAELRRRGIPLDTPVGLTGLEREFDVELTGRPGGELRAGDRMLAEVRPMKGNAVRTSIDVELQAAAVTALAGRLGGIAVMRPGSGEVLALAGIAYSAPQPPGSVFKIITLAGALQAGTVKPSDSLARPAGRGARGRRARERQRRVLRRQPAHLVRALLQLRLRADRRRARGREAGRGGREVRLQPEAVAGRGADVDAPARRGDRRRPRRRLHRDRPGPRARHPAGVRHGRRDDRRARDAAAAHAPQGRAAGEGAGDPAGRRPPGRQLHAHGRHLGHGDGGQPDSA